MRKRISILVVVLVAVGLCVAGWDTVPQPKPTIIDAILVVPANIVDQFGPTELTRVVYNIATLIGQSKAQEDRITALDARIATLEARWEAPVQPFEVPDPPEEIPEVPVE